MKKAFINISSLILFCLLIANSLVYSQESNYNSSYKKSESLEYTGEADLVIEGVEFTALSGPENKPCIWLKHCKNVIIRNCRFVNTPLRAIAVHAQFSENITVEDCYFENIFRGVVAAACKGPIKIEYNEVNNMVGFYPEDPELISVFQLVECNGPGSSISYNSIENIEGKCGLDDNINVYMSNGTSESPIMVKGNWVRGGGYSTTGGGILIGDFGGSYQISEDNIVVNPGQYGLGIAGGHDMILRNNKVYGERHPLRNVGLSINNWTEDRDGPSYNITVENNRVNWEHRDGFYHTAWITDNMMPLIPNWRTVIMRDPKIFSDILPDDIFNRTKKIIIENKETD